MNATNEQTPIVPCESCGHTAWISSGCSDDDICGYCKLEQDLRRTQSNLKFYTAAVIGHDHGSLCCSENVKCAFDILEMQLSQAHERIKFQKQ